MKRACSVCGTLKVVNPKSRAAIICHLCRRDGHSTRRTAEQVRVVKAREQRERRAAGKVLSPGNHRTRALKFGVEYEYVDRRRVFNRDRWRCGICRRPVDKRLKYPHPRSASLDHIVPMSKGGGHTYLNTQCGHLDCNLRKLAAGEGEQLALLG